MQDLYSMKGEGITVVMYHACLSFTRLRHEYTSYGPMPFFTLPLSNIITGAKNHIRPVFIFAGGNSVPILRGSPPL